MTDNEREDVTVRAREIYRRAIQGLQPGDPPVDTKKLYEWCWQKAEKEVLRGSG